MLDENKFLSMNFSVDYLLIFENSIFISQIKHSLLPILHYIFDII